MPKTRLGKWSIGFAVAFLLLLASLRLLVASGQWGGETFFSNLILAIPGILMGVFGVGAFFSGTISIIKGKERSIFVFLATLAGLLVLIFWLGEILSPH